MHIYDERICHGCPADNCSACENNSRYWDFGGEDHPIYIGDDEEEDESGENQGEDGQEDDRAP